MPSQATFEPAHRAEILLDRNALSASVHSQIRTGLNTEALPQFAWHSDPDGPSALLTLLDICTKICRSSSWVYENGLVPMFDKQGQKIKSAKIPPWPWETLPDPIVKVGKKAWTSSSFDSWLARMNSRSNHSADASNDCARGTTEVTA